MKEIKVLGSGENSMELAIMVVKAANELTMEYRLEQTSNEDEIISHGVIVTPAIVINGSVAFSGNTPEYEELINALK